ncbi:MAG: hypothetical protein V2J26_13140 [Pacificimonas sp.]|jgi:uncharacterized repeat protein (TIGR01451 family)|nr:hypothetical protein [Pacificimonas sp.]
MIKKSFLLLAAAAIPAQAIAADLGTDAGEAVSNTFSVTYDVNGSTQTGVSASVGFVVDRKINLTVAESGGTVTDVSVGASDAVTTFTVTNKTNDTMDFRLTAANVATNGVDDFFDVVSPTAYVESGLTAGYQAAEDTATFIDDLAEDDSVTVYIVSDGPTTGTNNQTAKVTLTAIASSNGSAAANDYSASGANNNATVDNLFADAGNDGEESADDTYRLQSATLTLTKVATVIEDPVRGTSNPLAVPGAVVEYCLRVANGGSADATNLSFSDNVPANVTAVLSGADFLFRTNDTSCTATDGADEDVDASDGGDTDGGIGSLTGTGGTNGNGVLSAVLSTVPATETRTVRFRVIVD